MRGETQAGYLAFSSKSFQSTPLMRGETGSQADFKAQFDISIHSPHARGDTITISKGIKPNYFNPLPSCEGRRCIGPCGGDQDYFNPLPSCEGRPLHRSPARARMNFNPLPSCEGRLSANRSPASSGLFQSTPLMRGETARKETTVAGARISIHSPHARGDVTAFRLSRRVQAFQSTPLMRGETLMTLCWQCAAVFQSTPLMRGETIWSAMRRTSSRFQSTPLMRGETA